ncbi:MAG: hypothetical protein WC635_01825 [Bacteriovorax sp.]|jgi:hypothetical protein
MKASFIVFSLFLSLTASARDMSRTETYDEAYRELKDGTSVYIGGCSLHQDYEKKKFFVTKTLVKYFEPYDMPAAEFKKKVKNAEKELLDIAGKDAGAESMSDVDDLTIEKIRSTQFKNLDLYRLNIGVGGGNGMYLVYNRTVVDNKPQYELLSNVFDGDVEFCDSKIWLKK